MSDECIDKTVDRVNLGDDRDSESMPTGDVGGDGADAGHDRGHRVDSERSHPLINSGT